MNQKGHRSDGVHLRREHLHATAALELVSADVVIVVVRRYESRAVADPSNLLTPLDHVLHANGLLQERAEHNAHIIQVAEPGIACTQMDGPVLRDPRGRTDAAKERAQKDWSERPRGTYQELGAASHQSPQGLRRTQSDQHPAAATATAAAPAVSAASTADLAAAPALPGRSAAGWPATKRSHVCPYFSAATATASTAVWRAFVPVRGTSCSLRLEYLP